MIRAAEIMLEQGFAGDFAVSSLSDRTLNVLSKLLSPAWKGRFHFISKEHTFDMMREARAALAKSGTVTLELAMQKCPTVVFYDLSVINRLDQEGSAIS